MKHILKTIIEDGVGMLMVELPADCKFASAIEEEF
jgi:hypothetical protein